jgi:hypothetical protein
MGGFYMAYLESTSTHPPRKFLGHTCGRPIFFSHLRVILNLHERGNISIEHHLDPQYLLCCSISVVVSLPDEAA